MTSKMTKEEGEELARLLPCAMFEAYCALAAGTIHCRVEIVGDETRWWAVPPEFFSRGNADHIVQVISPRNKCLPHRTAEFLWKFLKQKGAPPSLVVTFNSEEIKAAFPVSLSKQERMPESKMRH
jgi:hypothetical protein